MRPWGGGGLRGRGSEAHLGGTCGRVGGVGSCHRGPDGVLEEVLLLRWASLLLEFASNTKCPKQTRT